MLKDKYIDIESTRKRWDKHAKTYDKWYETFKGAVEHYVDWELLKTYLPKNRNAKILDAAGGTGRITVPLARMGYSVTLCDISPKMLEKGKQKLLKYGVLNKVEIVECDVCNLCFPDETFDFVLCWDGGSESTKELIRVTKKGGKISIFLVNKWAVAVSNFCKNPNSALTLIKSSPSYYKDEYGKHWAVSPEEAKNFFEAEGIKAIDTYAVCGWEDMLSIPKKILKSSRWDKKFFNQVTEMLLKLSKEPSVKGMSRHLVLYGEKI
jgi:ubiquinone/menaquinone biosynthesis C-methylase UbiE